MRKYLVFGMMGALALSFTACSSEDEMADVNPTYDPVANTVNTTFAMNIGTAGTTRMSAANTQATTSVSFRGIQDAKLLAFHQDTDDKLLTAAADAEKIFDLGMLLAKDQIAMDGSKSHRVLELALPMQTNTMLFYGRALKDGNAEDQGVINGEPGEPTTGTFNAVQKLSDIKFAATKRFSDEHLKMFTTTETLLAAIMNQLIGGKVEAANFWWPEANGYAMSTATSAFNEGQINTIASWTSATSEEVMTTLLGDACSVAFTADGNVVLTDALGNTYTYYKGVNQTWKTYGDNYAKNMDTDTSNDVMLAALEEILGNAYYQAITIEEGAVRAGSGPAVARVATDLYRALTKAANAVPTSYEEKVAQLVAKAVVPAFESYFDMPATATDDTGNTTYGTWKSAAAVLTAAAGLVDPMPAAAEIADLNLFPTDLTLPAGTAQLTCAKGTDADVFAYAGANVNMHMGDVEANPANGYVNVNNIVYPAELMYFGNSPLKVSAVSKTETDYPEGLTNWNNDEYGKWADFTGKRVVSTSRAVALAHEVNYGSALLETNVKFGKSTLADNRGSVHNGMFKDEGDEDVARDIQLIGVLVGSQPNQVGWNFLAPEDDSFNHVVYDHQIGDNGTEGIQINSSSVTATNYTLLFDNFVQAAGAAQKDVYVCLEFINNGKEFWGDHNLVRKGGTFYLVGKLPASVLTGDKKITFSDDHRSTPPYTAEGKSDQSAQRIFIQDYKTVANFTINDLKHAFVTVPDLRSSEISLGLSVDLKWEAGYTFDVAIGEETVTPVEP